MADTQVGDFGHKLIMTVRESGAAKNISSFTVGRIIRVRKPDLSEVDIETTAPFTTDGTDGKIEHTWADGELDQPGVWYAQAIVESVSSKTNTTWAKFAVGRNI